MNVTIGSQSCGSVTMSDLDTLSAFTCIVPPGPGLGDVQLRVRVDNGGSATTRFLYDPPHVVSVSPNPCQSNASCLVTLMGTNLGRRDPATAPNPVVLIGQCVWSSTEYPVAPCAPPPLHPVAFFDPSLADAGGEVCSQPNVINSSLLTCTAPVMRVGRYPVVVSLNGHNSSSGAVTIHRLCAAAQYGPPGEYCGPCPTVSTATSCPNVALCGR